METISFVLKRLLFLGMPKNDPEPYILCDVVVNVSHCTEAPIQSGNL